MGRDPRAHGTAPDKASPLTVDLLRRTIDALPPGLAGTRDRALLLVGFAGALRRSELIALDVDDVDPVSEGLVLTKRRSKTDQEAAGEQLGIPYGSNPSTCPVRAVDAWCQAARISDVEPTTRRMSGQCLCTRPGSIRPRARVLSGP